MKKAVLLLLVVLLASCESLYFYGQAVRGQLAILGKRRDIQALVDDPATDPDLKTRLESILAIREFADQELSLPVEDSYSTYVDLERPFVVWNVFAAPEFSLEPRDWCYPVAGCVTYRGYFTESAAQNYAARLAGEGYDVTMGGVAAYSTLGWFSDPVLNTVINREDYRLAALLFHELAHQVVYVPGDTEFNESFATTVELEGLRRWLQATENASAEALVERANRERAYRREFVDLVQRYVPRLESLYASAIPPDSMRREKGGLFDSMRRDYQAMKAGWDGYSAYDGWFAGEINNAKINTVGTYYNHVPGFEALLDKVGHDMGEFYRQAEELGDLPDNERRAALAALAGSVTGQ